MKTAAECSAPVTPQSSNEIRDDDLQKLMIVISEDEAEEEGPDMKSPAKGAKG